MTSWHSSPIITVKVGIPGENQQVFQVHSELLVNHSDFFRSALQRHFLSGQTGSVDLPDEQPQIFDAFARHVYNVHEHSCPDILQNIQAYVLGDMLLAPSFKQKILYDIRSELAFGTFTPEEVIGWADFVYGGTSTPNDELRITVARYFAAMSGKLICPQCTLTHCPHQPPPMFDADARALLVKSGLNEFIVDVLGQFLSPGVPSIEISD